MPRYEVILERVQRKTVEIDAPTGYIAAVRAIARAADGERQEEYTQALEGNWSTYLPLSAIGEGDEI